MTDDFIQGQLHGEAYIINQITDDGRVFGIRAVEITNPDEWRLVIIEQAEEVGDGSIS